MTDSTDNAPEPERTDAYLIVKRDLYYGPNSQGYTGVKDRAGRYTLAEVAVRFPNKESPNQDGMYYIHEDDAPEYSKGCYWDIRLEHQRDKALEEVARLRADLAPDPLRAVKVKPLVWREIETYGGQCFDAIALHTVYRIIPKHDGRYWLTEPDCSLPTLEAAKAAAQADYEQRIRSALEPADPLADPRVTALVAHLHRLTAHGDGLEGWTVDKAKIARKNWNKAKAEAFTALAAFDNEASE